MKVLIVGGSGMLGHDMVEEAERRGHEIVAPSVAELDITDPSAVARVAVGELGQFDWCVNCAAYTAVDRAEAEVEQATVLNAIAPGYLARACAASGLRLLHVSTDFVFDGNRDSPYSEDEPTNPLGAYGRTKRDGEEAVTSGHRNAIVTRTAWLYGPHGASFPKTMIRAWKARRQLRVVSDQIGCPTYTADLARVLFDLAEKDPFPGLYHAVGPQPMTWHEFALLAIRTYAELSGQTEEVEIEAIRTEDWPTPAWRPKYSVLSMAKLESLGIAPMRPVDEALAEFCRRLIEIGGDQ